MTYKDVPRPERFNGGPASQMLAQHQTNIARIFATPADKHGAMLSQWWASVEDDGPTLKQHWSHICSTNQNRRF